MDPNRLIDAIAAEWQQIWAARKGVSAFVLLTGFLVWLAASFVYDERLETYDGQLKSSEGHIAFLKDQLDGERQKQAAPSERKSPEVTKPEVKLISERKETNKRGTVTLTRTIEVVSAVLPASLVIIARSDNIQGMSVAPAKMIDYGGTKWWGKTDHTVSKQKNHISQKIEYPSGRYIVEVSSRSENIQIEYRFEE